MMQCELTAVKAKLSLMLERLTELSAVLDAARDSGDAAISAIEVKIDAISIEIAASSMELASICIAAKTKPRRKRKAAEMQTE